MQISRPLVAPRAATGVLPVLANSAPPDGAGRTWPFTGFAVGHQTAADLTGKSAAQEQARQERAAAQAARPSHAAQYTDDITSAERRLAPGSRAWRRRESLAEGRRSAAQSAADFRQALADAAASTEAPQAAATAPTPPLPTSDPNAAPAAAPPPVTNEAGSAAASDASAGARGGPAALASGAEPGAAVGATRATPAATTPAVAVSAGGVTVMPGATAAPGAGVAAAAITATSGVTAGSAPAAGGRGADGLGAAGGARGAGEATPAKARAAARPQAPEGKNDAQVERVLRYVRAQIGKERSHAIMRLDPPELGRIRIQMDTVQQRVALRIDTQSDVAHRLLAREVDALRQGLEAAGLHLEKVEIRPPESTEHGALHDDSSQPDRHTDGREHPAGTEAGHAEPGWRPGTAESAEERGRDDAADAAPVRVAGATRLNLVA